MNKKKKGFIIAISIICIAILATMVSISLFMRRPVLEVKENVMVEVGGSLSVDEMITGKENISAVKILPDIERNDTYDEAVYASVSSDGQEISAGYQIGSYIVTIEAEGGHFGSVKKEVVINVYVNSQDDSEPITDLDDTVEPNEVTESPVKKEFTFLSAEEVENISDEDLIVIVSNGYTREDFFGEGSFATIDLFDVPMMVPTEEEPENSYEYIMMQILYSDDVSEAIDLNSPISSDIINAYAQKDVAEFMDMQNTRDPGEDTGVLVKDEETIFCGETDSYSEYSARYTDSRSLYENDVLVTHNIPRAYRHVYMKTLVHFSDMEGRPLVMLGDLSKEYVQEQLDYFNNKAGMIMYREVTEDENSYIYTYYYAYTVYGDFGLNNEANLVKSSFIVDKETHVVSYGNEERVKAVEIEGTAQDWPEEW